MKSVNLVAGIILSVTCSGALAAEVYSEIFTYGSFDNTTETIKTATPGQTISSTAQASTLSAGTANASAKAQTFFGINRIGTFSELVYHNPPNGNIDAAYTDSWAYSFWTDGLTVQGGSQGDLVNVSFQGSIDYSIANPNNVPLVAGNGFLQIGYQLQISSNIDQKVIAFTASDFAAGSSINWSVTVAALSGGRIDVFSLFHSLVDGGSFGIEQGTGRKSFTLDAMRSSTLELINIDSGYTLASEAGELVASSGGFIYQATAVPEPETYALMLAGLAAVLHFGRRRLRASC